MGADYLGFRGCKIQQPHGAQSFLELLKLRASVAHAEASAAAIEAATKKPLEELSFRISGTNNPARTSTFAEARRRIALLDPTLDDCRSCPLSGSDTATFGCWQYVTYPIDAAFESTFFDYFVRGLDNPPLEWCDARDRTGKPLSTAMVLDLLFFQEQDELVLTPWFSQRGDRGPLAELPVPLFRDVQGRSWNSAQALFAAFQPIDGLPALQLFESLFARYVEFLETVDPSRWAGSKTIAEVKQLAERLRAWGEFARGGLPLEVLVSA